MPQPGTCIVCKGAGVVLLGGVIETPHGSRMRPVHAARLCQLCRGCGRMPKKPAQKVRQSRVQAALRKLNAWRKNRALFRYWPAACRCIVGFRDDVDDDQGEIQ